MEERKNSRKEGRKSEKVEDSERWKEGRKVGRKEEKVKRLKIMKDRKKKKESEGMKVTIRRENFSRKHK